MTCLPLYEHQACQHPAGCLLMPIYQYDMRELCWVCRDAEPQAKRSEVQNIYAAAPGIFIDISRYQLLMAFCTMNIFCIQAIRLMSDDRGMFAMRVAKSATSN